MSHSRGDLAHAGVRVALPAGWIEVDPEDDGAVVGSAVQVITPADWNPADGLRPTMTVAVTPAMPDHAAARVLAEVQERLREVHVVSIDPWRVPSSTVTGRRLAFAHVEGDTTLCTLVWAMTAASGDVIISAHVESTQLHLHDRAFTDAVAGVRLPEQQRPATAEPPGTADLARAARSSRWADVTPATSVARAPMVADPDARILVEASVGATSLRFDATLSGNHATISATPSPREVNHPAASAAGGPDRRVEQRTTTFRIPVTMLALAVARWLGLGPAWTAATRPVTVPISLLMNRLVDPSIPAPEGVDTTTWHQPWFLWTLRSSATDSGLVMVDTGTSGQCAVMETDDEHTTRFAPLSTYNVWLTLNWLVSESLVG